MVLAPTCGESSGTELGTSSDEHDAARMLLDDAASRFLYDADGSELYRQDTDDDTSEDPSCGENAGRPDTY